MDVAFVHGLVAGLGIAIPVGAIAVLIIDTGRRWGFRVAVHAGLGAALADFAYAVVANAVGLSVAHILATHTALIHWVSAVILGIIAAHTLWRTVSRREDEAGTAPPPQRSRLVLTFLGLTLANPLTITYFAALVAGESGHLGGNGAVAFVLGVFLASFSWQTFLATVGAVLGRQLPSGARQVTGVLGSLIVAVLAVRLVLMG